MLSTKLLSVVIPIYNVEKYLDKCLESVINQTYKNIEIICVNDGSEDNSQEIIDKYTRSDDRIRSLVIDNKGPVLARRIGMNIASGEYITFVDSDDWIDSTMYSEMMNTALKSNADVVTSGFIREYENGSKEAYEGIFAGIYKEDKLVQEYFTSIIGTQNFFEFHVTGSYGNKVFRTTLLKKFQELVPKDIIMGEDPAAVYPAILHANTVAVMGKNYYHYRIRKDSITSSEKEFIDDNQLNELFNHMDSVLIDQYKEIPNLKLQMELWKKYIILSKWPDRVIKVVNGRLFPYKNVYKKDRIILYGNGRFGRFLYRYLLKQGFRVIGVSDSRGGEGIICIEKYPYTSIDKIIISVLRADDVKEIQEHLLKINIPKEKIQAIDSEILIRDIEGIS